MLWYVLYHAVQVPESDANSACSRSTSQLEVRHGRNLMACLSA